MHATVSNEPIILIRAPLSLWLRVNQKALVFDLWDFFIRDNENFTRALAFGWPSCDDTRSALSRPIWRFWKASPLLDAIGHGILARWPLEFRHQPASVRHQQPDPLPISIWWKFQAHRADYLGRQQLWSPKTSYPVLSQKLPYGKSRVPILDDAVTYNSCPHSNRIWTTRSYRFCSVLTSLSYQWMGCLGSDLISHRRIDWKCSWPVCDCSLATCEYWIEAKYHRQYLWFGVQVLVSGRQIFHINIGLVLLACRSTSAETVC